MDSLSPAALLIREVTKRFGRHPANDRVSLAVEAGQLVGLLGPNGAGKTTLIRICAGWLAPDAGVVELAGARQSLTSRAARRGLGVVSDDAPLYGELTVDETLAYWATLHGLDRAAARRAGAEARGLYLLDEFRRQRVGRLSSGQRQRVRIACALLANPAVLLLDEPTAGLDPATRRHTWELLRQAAARGVAVLMSTHNLEEAAHLCCAVHLLRGGRIVSRRDLAADPATAAGLEQEYLAALADEATGDPAA